MKLICPESNAAQIIFILFSFYLQIVLFQLGSIIQGIKNESFHRFQQEPQLLISQSRSLLSLRTWQGSLPPGRVSAWIPGKVGTAPDPISQPASGAAIKTLDLFHFSNFI